MNYKILLGLILLSVIVFPYLPATTQGGGQIPTTIQWGAETQQDTGIRRIASGEYDVFLFANPLSWYEGLPEDVKANLTLIRSAAGFYDIVVNPAQNVIDPDAGGEVKLLGTSYPGKIIPGLVYVDPPSNWVNISDVTDYTKLHFNPFALYKARQALNYLINREQIVNTILGGSGTPRYGAISNLHPFYTEGITVNGESAESIYFTWFGFTPTGDTDKAQQLFTEAMNEANAILSSYGMAVYYDPGQDRWIFRKPDATEEVIEVVFVIRQEDERLYVGQQIAAWIEQYFNITVAQEIKDRTIIYKIYVDNLVATKPELHNRIWHLYTEGWVTTAEDIDVGARYDVAFFYAPLRGYGSNSRFTFWWYWYNETFYQIGLNLYYGVYTQDTIDWLYGNITLGLKMGLNESMRIFICDTFEYFAVNKNTVLGMVPGVVTGLNTVWALRTLKMTKSTAKLLQYSSTGALFMSSWNPVLGFTDIYSELIHRLATDFGMWPRPDNGMPQPIRVAGWSVERGVSLPSDAYIYDPVNEEWRFISNVDSGFINYTYGNYGGYNTTAILLGDWSNVGFVSPEPLVKVTLNYRLGKWHDGSDMTIHDFLYAIGFSYEWAYNDELSTGETDPYYEDGIESNTLGFLATIFGWKVINDTAMEVYMDYDDVYDILVAWYGVVYPDMPWHVMYAAEEIIANQPTLPSGKAYAWEDSEGYEGIDFIDATQSNDVVYYIETNLTIGPRMPPYITTYPGVAAPTSDEAWARYNNTVWFYGNYSHTYISSGPYMITHYTPPPNPTITMVWFTDYVYPQDYWVGMAEVKKTVVTSTYVPTTTVWLVYGQGFKIMINFELEKILPTYEKITTINTSKVIVGAALLDQNGNRLAGIPQEYITVYPNGTIIIDVPAAWLQQYIPTGHTPYYVSYLVAYEGAQGAETGTVELEIYSTPIIPTPEPTLLPLILLAALLLIMLIIRRK